MHLVIISPIFALVLESHTLRVKLSNAN